MVEKFSDFESVGFISEEGEFVFTVEEAELKDSKNGNPMVVLQVKSDAGKSTIYHTLQTNARWSYNNLIKACLKLDTKEKINAFECDYEIIHNELIGKQFIGVVTADTYEKEVKKPLDDGTFATTTETKTSYKITTYKFAK